MYVISFIIVIKYWQEETLLVVIQFIISTVLAIVTFGIQLWPQKMADWIPSVAKIMEENVKLTSMVDENNKQIEILKNEVNNLRIQISDMKRNVTTTQSSIDLISESSDEVVREDGNMEVILTSPKLQITVKDIDVFKITWNKVEDAEGYELYYSTNGKSYKKLATTKKTIYNHKKLKENKKYHYKVRAYIKTNWKVIYGKYSETQAKKCTNYLIDFYSVYETRNTDIYGSNDAYNEYKNGSTFIMGGIEYSNGFVFGYTDWYNGKDYNNRDMSAFFNLRGKYKSITFSYACIDGHAQDSIIKIYSDDEFVKELEFGSGDLPQTVTVNIQHASKLEIAVYGNYIGFANVQLNK